MCTWEYSIRIGEIPETDSSIALAAALDRLLPANRMYKLI